MPSLKGESALLGDDNPDKSQIKGDFISKQKVGQTSNPLYQAAHVKATWGKR